MENYSYYTFHGVPCVLIEREDKITLIPCNKDDHKLLAKYMQDSKFLIKYAGNHYQYSHAFINTLIFNSESIDLYPDYIIHSISPNFCAMVITGPAVDDFFSPSAYYFNKYSQGIRDFGNVVYKNEVADEWAINFKNNRLKLGLSYGNILSRGIASDLMLHPKLKIEFEETDDPIIIYDIYKAIKRFFHFILYRSNCGNFDIELFGTIDGKYSSIGRLFDSHLSKDIYDKQIGNICYSYYKEYISSLLQFVFNDPLLYLKHLPIYGIRNWEKDDIELLLTQLFTAFENECHKRRTLYENADDSKIQKVKNDLLASINNVMSNQSSYTNEEKQFISDAKQRITQLGTQFGQKTKIVNAYKILSSSIESSIPDILYRHKEFRTATELTEEQINCIAKQLTQLRGSIVHGEEHNKFSLSDCQLIHFFEVLIYAQMLFRANIPLSDIKLIIRSTILLRFDLFDKTMNDIENNKRQIDQ